MFSHTAELPTFGAPANAERRGFRMVATAFTAILLAAVPAWLTSAARTDDSRVAGAVSVPRGASTIVTSLDRRSSHNERYEAEVVSATPFALGVPQRWTIRLNTPDSRAVADARVEVKSWAPETGRVSRIRPTARYIGNGRYQVDNIYFARPGLWNVAFVVRADAGVDSLAFNVIMPDTPARNR
jgi:hypothetical protein